MLARLQSAEPNDVELRYRRALISAARAYDFGFDYSIFYAADAAARAMFSSKSFYYHTPLSALSILPIYLRRVFGYRLLLMTTN